MKKLARIAKVRAWTAYESDGGASYDKKSPAKKDESKTANQRVEHFLVFDTETDIDKEQRFNFGSAVYYAVGSRTGEFIPCGEWLIYADDLPERNPEGFAVLQEYVKRGHPTERGEFSPAESKTLSDWYHGGEPEGSSASDFLPGGKYDVVLKYPKNEFSSVVDNRAVIKGRPERTSNDEIILISQSDFNYEVLQFAAFPSEDWKSSKPATVVGFNLPFDLSRIALGVRKSTGYYSGGFSFRMKEDAKSGDIRTVKRGIKGALYSYTGDKRVGKDYFTDVGTLAFGLTNGSYSLKSAAKAFSVEEKMAPDGGHGSINLNYISYNRQDVKATAAVYIALINELDRHPIDLNDSQVYSPASLAKSYLSAMGVPKPLEKEKDFPNDILGYSMSTFYGGRSEAHIRKVGVPVEYCDVTSMYPTVNACMGLWDLLTHERIEVREDTEEVRKFVEEITVDDLFNKGRWPELRGIVQIAPDGDLLPIRAAFKPGESETIGIGYLSGGKPMWYSLPDIVNAKINGGKSPKILKAYRFYPDGDKVGSLKSVKLGGDIPIDPSSDDFFQHVIEQKQAAKKRHPAGAPRKGCTCEGCRNEQFLKVLANAGGYGIFVEINRDDSAEDSKETIYGALGNPWETNVYKPEAPGQYCFPPIGTLITGAARLILGMLEKLVTDAGGTWAMCDTDSMAIVASHNGGFMAPEPCIPPKMVDQNYPERIPILTYETVESIRKRFDSLSPYDPEIAGPIPILKREMPESLDDPQVYCYAISAKRYAVFTIDDSGDIEIISNKEHGLGQYMNPEDPALKESRGMRQWVCDIWRYMILTDAGRPIPEPYWFSRPAMSRVNVSTWSTYGNLRHWNDGKSYRDQIKPRGFMMAPVASHSYLEGGMASFRLVGSFNSNADEWESMDFYNIHDMESRPYRITTDAPNAEMLMSDSGIRKVKSYRDVVSRYAIHPEIKFSDANGNICGEFTRGILHRHHVEIVTFEHHGKEANLLEERDTGMILDGMESITNYSSGENDFSEFAAPILKTFTQKKLAQMVKDLGVSISVKRLGDVLRGNSEPRDSLRNALLRVAVRKAIEEMGDEIPERRWKNEEIALSNWREVLHSWRVVTGDLAR
ncbi:hypothetical protein PV396_44730 [Streptomyces sp. ME02-8801-2C]|uniref:hypothetical protein n=1 Tax=Streptomyces sp. ME02-8801-2C TaxID=3028680 RepID=UPI0029A04D74|nr:hypothetical protein [Streptomyces sp. ME02-8801-2C]MDX3458949.1 hypothetical protein [Streptomyces sp. ME02-8801-2C]